jgi:hypothetical protein
MGMQCQLPIKISHPHTRQWTFKEPSNNTAHATTHITDGTNDTIHVRTGRRCAATAAPAHPAGPAPTTHTRHAPAKLPAAEAAASPLPWHPMAVQLPHLLRVWAQRQAAAGAHRCLPCKGCLALHDQPSRTCCCYCCCWHHYCLQGGTGRLMQLLGLAAAPSRCHLSATGTRSCHGQGLPPGNSQPPAHTTASQHTLS